MGGGTQEEVAGAPAVNRAHAAAVYVVAERIADHKEEIAQRTIERFCELVVGWQQLDDSELDRAREFVLRNVESFVASLEHNEPLSEELLAAAREEGARRVHQGVTFDALFHCGRLWGETLWEFVLAAAWPDRPDEREAALEIAGRVWTHLDGVATAVTHAYLDEVTDRGLLGRDLLDALLAGHGESDAVLRLSRLLHRRLTEDYVVVVIRPEGAPSDDGSRQSRATQLALDRIVATTRTTLLPTAGSLLLAIRQGDVVALYPIDEPSDVETVRRECARLIRSLSFEVSVGMSGWDRGRAAIATGYAEAREAADIAAGTGISNRAITLDDVLVDHMLRGSPHARRLLAKTLRPLTEYDSAHRSDLVGTLRAYLRADANLTRTAGLLTVHPNTVVYRLRRIRELTARDPNDMHDLQMLFLALKLAELSG